MKVSLNLANQYSNVDLKAIPIQTMLDKVGQQLGAVEEVIDWASRYNGVVVAKIVSCHKHPNADKLNICLIDDGKVVKDVTRSSEGLVQVVCGAPNVREGLLVVWLPPGVTVPSSFDKDPFVLTARELRGEVSNGMLASARELALGDDHDGILEIDSSNRTSRSVEPGSVFAPVYSLDDTVIDCENKMFTHRPDCFGVLGVARELAGINGLKFESPDWYSLDAVQRQTNEVNSQLPLTGQNNITDKVPRFLTQVVEGVSVKPSSLEIQSALLRQGSRPVNNLVDFTNYFMHLTAQPTHAFDYDKVKALCKGPVAIFPRMANDGETIKLLNGKTATLTANDIVISTDTQAIALGGVMGGSETEVDANTKNIIIECANFDMYTIRRTSMRHGIFSDAVTRFNKGQSKLQNPVVLQKLVNDICQSTGGKAGLVYDSAPEMDGFQQLPVQVTSDFINSVLGSNLSADAISELLQKVEFNVQISGNNLEVSAPFWRTDIELPEDVVEEVGRLYGYDKLPVQLPVRSSAPVAKNPRLEQSRRLRELLAKCGANEVLTYSFVSEQLLDAAGQNSKEAYQLSNALSPELQYYRLTLTPSLLSKVTQNLRAGYDKFAIFEIGKTHLKLQGVNEEGLPQENPMLSLVVSTNDKLTKAEDGAAYYQAKQYLEKVATFSGLDLDYEPLTDEVHYEIVKPFQPGRAALITDKTSGNYLGVIGEFKPGLRKKLKLPEHTAGLEIMLEPLLDLKATNPYAPLSKYPAISQDVTFTGPETLEFGNLKTTLDAAIQNSATTGGYKVTCQPLGIYHKPKTKNKNLSFRLSISNPVQTLTTDQASSFVDEVVAVITKQLKIKRT